MKNLVKAIDLDEPKRNGEIINFITGEPINIIQKGKVIRLGFALDNMSIIINPNMIGILDEKETKIRSKEN